MVVGHEVDVDNDVSENDEDQEDESFDDDDNDISCDANQYRASSGRFWNKEPAINQKTARMPAINIFRPARKPGPLPSLKHDSIMNIFDKIFTPNLKTEIIKWTNAKAAYCYQVLNETRQRKRQWKPLTLSEFDAYLGCLLYIGAMRDAHRNLVSLWSIEEGHVILRATISYERFRLITQFLRFDDSLSRRSQPRKHREISLLQPVESMVNIMNHNLTTVYQSDENLTIDEQLKGFRGRCKFRQYMPAKPSKYGIKLWWITDSRTAFPLRCQIYTGSQQTISSHGRAYDVVMYLMEGYLNTGRNLTIDNYFTSIELALKLKDKKQLLLVLFGKTKREIVMKEIVDENMCLKRTGQLFYYQQNMHLLLEQSLVPKTNQILFWTIIAIKEVLIRMIN